MKKKIFGTLSVILAAGLILSGCGSKASMSASYDTADYAVETAENYDYSYGSDVSYEDSGSLSTSVDPANAQEGLKIIYNGSLSVEALDYDASIAAVKEAISSYGGYIQSTNESGGIHYDSGYTSSRYASITARIPTEKYNDFMTASGSFGNITSKSESTEDITSSYLDVEARLSSLETQEARLLELVEKADDIDTILAIETQLSDVRYQIESYTSQMRTYENLLSYSTIDIYIDEVTETTPASEPSFGQKLLSTFRSSGEAFVSVLNGLLVVIIYLLPFTILTAVIILIVRAVKKAYRRKHPEAQASYEAKKAARKARKEAKKKKLPAEASDAQNSESSENN